MDMTPQTRSGWSVAPRSLRSTLALVVQDDAAVRDLICEALVGAGIEVAVASDGAEALVILERGTERQGEELRPDVIILDLLMPVMDGWSFARAYHATAGPHAPLLLVSGVADLPASASTVGAAAFVAKPFDVDDLCHAVRALLTKACHSTISR